MLILRGDYRGRSDVWDDIINRDLTVPGSSDQPMRLRPELSTVGFRVSWLSADRNWRVSAWGQNLTEEEEILNIGPPQPNTVDRPTASVRRDASAVP